MSKRPITKSGIPAPLRDASSAAPTDALADLVGDDERSLRARARLTVCHVSTALADAFEMVYLTIGEGDALVTLAADVACEVRVRDRVSALAFGDVVLYAGEGARTADGHAVDAVFFREDVRTELEGPGGVGGALVLSASNRSIVEGIAARFVVSGDILLLEDGLHRVAQSVSTAGGRTSVHLDRPIPLDSSSSGGVFENWRYLRRTGAAAHTQLRAGEGTLTLAGNDVAAFTPTEPGRGHAICAGDTVAVGLHARTVVAATDSELRFDEGVPEMLTGASFAWLPPDGEVVAHMLLRGDADLLVAGALMRVGGANVDGETGSYGDGGASYATYAGKRRARYLDAKDVLHVRMRAGDRQVLSGFPLRGRESVSGGSPQLICAQSVLSASAIGGPPQLYHGFSIRVEPPQTTLSRFVNV